MKKYAILIGINQYHESLGRLKYSVNDCRRLAQVLTTGDDAFSAENVIVLADDDQTDHRPTYANIHSWLASWLAQPGEDDTILVFFAGHGREIDGKCYLVPGDATLQTIHVTGIPVPYIQELLNRCKARQKVLILDACHSGAGRDVMTMSSTMQSTLSKAKGIYTITSCGANETSHEWEDKKQGLFSYYFAQALSGQCPPNATGILTLEGIYEWVYEKVSGWAVRHRCSQNPQRLYDGIGSLTIKSVIALKTLNEKEETRIEDTSLKEQRAKVQDFEQDISCITHRNKSAGFFKLAFFWLQSLFTYPVFTFIVLFVCFALIFSSWGLSKLSGNVYSVPFIVTCILSVIILLQYVYYLNHLPFSKYRSYKDLKRLASKLRAYGKFCLIDDSNKIENERVIEYLTISLLNHGIKMRPGSIEQSIKIKIVKSTIKLLSGGLEKLFAFGDGSRFIELKIEGHMNEELVVKETVNINYSLLE